MSRHSSLDNVITINDDNPEGLEVIREELYSSAISSIKMNATSEEIDKKEEIETSTYCACKPNSGESSAKAGVFDVEKLILEREKQLKEEFAQSMEKQISNLKENLEYILQNEQIRTSYMLREAHRERQEKISVLQTQLECKNLAGLMYVMCSERRKRKLEKLRIIEEYTNYIRALQEILKDGQDLILHLSRGYKTAAKVDNEWREKMKKIIKEFQAYIYHFNGGAQETNQYLLDLPQLLTIDSPLKDNLLDNPCEEQELEHENPTTDKSDQPWWEQLEGDCKPFVMFGDMAEFQPPQRRAVLKVVKAAKTAPSKWKNYVFNNMFLHSSCENADTIKDEYPERFPETTNWECQGVQTVDQSGTVSFTNNNRFASIDVRGNMGSLLKIITNAAQPSPSNKATLLAARDSMEIASTTKLRERRRQSEHSKVLLKVGQPKGSDYTTDPADNRHSVTEKEVLDKTSIYANVEEEEVASESVLGSTHNDSLHVIPSHKPDHDHKIHCEKVCPMEKCQRMQVDSFIRSLPPYMRDSPFMHFEQTYEDYEACSPEQLEILRRRIAERSKVPEVEIDECPLAEWTPSAEGVACQTSEMDLGLPPCTCQAPVPTPEGSEVGNVYRVEDLFPIKQAINKIKKECFYDDRIDFDRFKVIGQESCQELSKNKEEFNRTRQHEIRKILKKHPSLCDIFLANR